MARQPRGRDWQERAFDEAQTKRSKSKIGESQDSPDPLRVSAELPKRNSLRWTAIGLVIIVVAVLIRNGISSHPPSLTTSCTTPGIALSSTSVHTGSTLRWSLTGPPETALAITIGVARLVRTATPGQLHAQPQPGRSNQTAEIAVGPHALDSSCKANGLLAVRVPTGQYTVRLFKVLNPSTASISAVPVASKPLTVTP
jgi:hypothetical protein